MHPLLRVVVLAAVGFACTEPVTQPLWLDDHSTLASAATVDRGQIDLVFISIDPTAGYSLYIGATAEELAQICSTEEDVPLVNTWTDHAVSLPTGGLRFLDRGEMPVVVFLGIVFFDDMCEGAPIYATGTTKVVVNEHFPGENGGAYTIGIRGTGTVTTTEGDRFSLHHTGSGATPPNGTVHGGDRISLTPLD